MNCHGGGDVGWSNSYFGIYLITTSLATVSHFITAAHGITYITNNAGKTDFRSARHLRAFDQQKALK